MKISELFTQFGSDKATEHTYGDFYDTLTQSMKINSVLEVGVEAGYSMSSWVEFLPEANIVGIDKDVTPEDSISRIESFEIQKEIRIDEKLSQMLRHHDYAPPYKRLNNLKVLQCNIPDFSSVIELMTIKNWKFDLIIDDASHTENDQVLTWHYLNDFLSDNGVFVIEDIQNEQVIKRLDSHGWKIVDLRHRQNRWDDVIAYKNKDGIEKW